MFAKLKIAADKIFVIVIAILFLTIIVALIASVSHFRQVSESAKMVAHAQDVIIQAEELSALVIDNETLSRGYAITGKKELVNTLEKSKADISKQFASLRSLTSDNPDQQVKLDSLIDYIQLRISFSDTIVAVCDNIGNTAAIGKIANGQGKIYTDNAKKIIRQIQNAENGLLLQRKELNERKMVELRVIFLSVIIFMLILLVVLIQKVNTDYKEKKKAAERLSKLNEALEDKVAARTKELSASKKTLEETFLRITDAFIALDKNWCYTYINKRAAEMLRMDANDLVGKNIWEVFPGAVNSSAYHAFHKAFEQQQFVLNEDYYQPLDLWQENHIYPSPEGISVYINDISEKKKAEEKIVKANRLYFFISQVNQMIVRTTTEEVLFKEACRIAVEVGKFKMAWIGLIDEKTNSIVPVMYAGEERGYLSMIKIIVTGDVQEGRGPTGKAAREGIYVICNDIATDPSMAPWRNEALQRGYLSSMSLPIKKSNKVLGAFSFYAGEKDFFDTSEIALLEEATVDVSFALENFENEKLRKLAEDEITKANDRFEMIALATNDVLWDWNLLTNEIWWNNNFYKLFGHNKQKKIPDINSWINGIHPEDRKKVTDGIRSVIDSGGNFWQDEYRHLKTDGAIVYVYDRGFVLHDENAKPTRMIGSMLDITELKKAAEEIVKEKNLSDSIINSLPGIFYLYSKEGKFLRWNRNFETVSKYNTDEISQMHPLDFFDACEKQLLTEKISNVFLVGEDNVQADFLLKTKEKIPYYFTGKAIEYEGENCLMGVGIDFSENLKAQKDIEQSAEKLQQLTIHLLEVRELERKRIGREIHDELGQQLTAIKMDVTWVNRKMPEGLIDVKDKLKSIINLINGSNQSIRRILSELRPTILDDYGLIEALDWLGAQFTETTGIPVTFTKEMKSIKISEQITTCIFRIYQEALTNITRYAGAKKVTTNLNITGESVLFSVQDDGIGFNVNAISEKKSFGILGMKERVQSLKGSFTLDSEPGKGTIITISLPFNITSN